MAIQINKTIKRQADLVDHLYALLPDNYFVVENLVLAWFSEEFRVVNKCDVNAALVFGVGMHDRVLPPRQV